jgi:hypothetical protein
MIVPSQILVKNEVRSRRIKKNKKISKKGLNQNKIKWKNEKKHLIICHNMNDHSALNSCEKWLDLEE